MVHSKRRFVRRILTLIGFLSTLGAVVLLVGGRFMSARFTAYDYTIWIKGDVLVLQGHASDLWKPSAGWDLDFFHKHKANPHYRLDWPTATWTTYADGSETLVVVTLPAWTILLFGLFLVGRTTAKQLLLRKGRFEPGKCRTCGYDLTGNISGVCSECGREIGPDETTSSEKADAKEAISDNSPWGTKRGRS